EGKLSAGQTEKFSPELTNEDTIAITENGCWKSMETMNFGHKKGSNSGC
ncbi:hypothetical protein A2U01_0119251, partial [Trifolium medium]|nr:hypothetical protein [Trifolium medium]